MDIIPRQLTSTQFENERIWQELRFEFRKAKTDLAEKEHELNKFRSQLLIFERKYYSLVGGRYAELDDLKAQIAECYASHQPDNIELEAKAQVARAQAEASSQNQYSYQDAKKDEQIKHSASKNLKQLYYYIAKLVHPDLSCSETDKATRTKLFLELNKAYETGEEQNLKSLLEVILADMTLASALGTFEEQNPEWSTFNLESEICELSAQIVQVKSRLTAIDHEIEGLKQSQLYQLWVQVKTAAENKKDLLSQMANNLNTDIERTRQQLNELLRN